MSQAMTAKACARARVLPGLARQQRGQVMLLVEVLDDRERLREALPVMDQCRHACPAD